MVDEALAVIGALGFGASLTMHLLTYRGYSVSQEFSMTWLLDVGVFVVALPAVLRLRGLHQSTGERTSLIDHIPVWLLVVAIISGPLLFAGGLAAMVEVGGVPKNEDGRYQLVNHGESRDLSEREFRHLSALQDRLTSAVLTGMYGYAAAVLIFVPRRKESEKRRLPFDVDR